MFLNFLKSQKYHLFHYYLKFLMNLKYLNYHLSHYYPKYPKNH